jgi:hypothetical protein
VGSVPASASLDSWFPRLSGCGVALPQLDEHQGRDQVQKHRKSLMLEFSWLRLVALLVLIAIVGAIDLTYGDSLRTALRQIADKLRGKQKSRAVNRP